MARQKSVVVDSNRINENEDTSSQLNANEDTNHGEGQEANVVIDGIRKVKKRGRGRSTMAFFACKNGQPNKVEWNRYGQAIGENEKKFRSACAYYAHCHWLWPLDKKWKEMPKEAYLNTWKLLEKDFILDGHPNAFTFIFKIVHDRFRDWKNTVKGIWIEYGNQPDDMEAEIMKNPRIDRTQFMKLVAQWNTHESRANAIINKANRDAKSLNHKCGRRPIAMIRDDFEKTKNMEATTVDLMKVMYRDTTETEDMERNVREIMASQPDASLAEVEIETYAKVVKPTKVDYVRFLGVGHDKSNKHSEWERMQASLQRNTSDQELIKKLEERIASRDELIERLSARIEHQDFLLHQYATWMQQLGQHVGFPYPLPQPYRQNAYPSGPSASVGARNDETRASDTSSLNGSENVESSGVGDGFFSSTSRCPPPFVGGNSAFNHYVYPQPYPFPSFSMPTTQVNFHHQHHACQVDTTRHPQDGHSVSDPLRSLRTSRPKQPPTHPSLSQSR